MVYDLDTLQPVNEAVSGSYHFTLDAQGNIYYGNTTEDGFAVVEVKKVGEKKAGIFYQSEKPMSDAVGPFCGYFDVFYDGSCFYLDNRTLLDFTEEFAGRCILVLNDAGEKTDIWSFAELERQYGKTSVEFSCVLYQDETAVLLVLESAGVHRYILDKASAFDKMAVWEELQESASTGVREPVVTEDVESSEMEMTGQSTIQGETCSIPYLDKNGERQEMNLEYNLTATGNCGKIGRALCVPEYCILQITDFGEGELVDSWQYPYGPDRDCLAMFERDVLEQNYVFQTSDGSLAGLRVLYSQKIGKLPQRGTEKNTNAPFGQIETFEP